MKTKSAEPTEARVLEILDEYLAGLRAGRPPDREALLARHPDLAASLAASFRALDFVHVAGRALEAPEPRLGGEEPASAGRVLGDYRLLREIGRGGMAVVYEAEQVSLGRHVALKVLPFAAVLEPKQLQRFKNEAQAAAHLQHPHIVPVHAVGCEHGVHFYAMQYVEGRSLAVAIREMREMREARAAGGHGSPEDPTVGGSAAGSKTPISSHGSNREPAYVRMAARLGVQAAEALDYAHQVGIVHRDVKPGNLLVDLAGTLWITDFGLAHTMKDAGLTITGELLGTIRYMSPEQALAKRVPIDHRTDVYSLGATLYELLTLEPAFPGDDPVLVLKDIASKEPVPPRRLNPALPRDLETVLQKAMAKDPAGRYATAHEMANDLGRFLENRPIEARRPGPVRRAAKWGRRHRVLVGSAAGVLALAVAGLVTGTALLWREKEQTKTAFDRAEANLGLALKALDQIYVHEAEGHPQIREGLPRDLLEKGLGFYEEFARENARDQKAARYLGDAHHRASLIFRRLGRKDQADAALQRAVSTYRELLLRWPGNPFPHHNLGVLLREKGDLDGATDEFREAIRLDPNDAETYYGLGYVLADKGLLGASIREFREAIRVRPGYADAYNGLGNSLFDKGDAEGAFQAFSEALRLEPDFAEARAGLGNAIYARDPEGAIREYREALRLRPDLAIAHSNLGVACYDKGDLEGAIREYREALRLDPDNARTRTNFANALHATGDLAGAIRENRAAIELQPGFFGSHFNLAQALVGVDPEGAIREYREAIRLGPDLPVAHFNLANGLLARGDAESATREYREAIRLQPDFAEAHNGLGAVLQGDPDAAIREFREAIRLKPGIAIAHGNLGSMLRDKGDPRGAIEAFREAVRLDPSVAEAHGELGYLLLVTGDAAGAVPELRQAVRLKADYASAHCYLGLALTRQGNWREALPWLRKGHELGSSRRGWSLPSQRWIEDAERKAELEGRLEQALSGEVPPRDALERIGFAQVLFAKSRHVASARMYAEAFAEDAALAEDLPKGHRYNAACAAARAAAREDADAAECRGRALEWLRADLAARVKAPTDLVATLEHWRKDPDLAGVRDRLGDLPGPEGEAWRGLWAAVDGALASAR